MTVGVEPERAEANAAVAVFCLFESGDSKDMVELDDCRQRQAPGMTSTGMVDCRRDAESNFDREIQGDFWKGKRRDMRYRCSRPKR